MDSISTISSPELEELLGEHEHHSYPSFEGEDAAGDYDRYNEPFKIANSKYATLEMYKSSLREKVEHFSHPPADLSAKELLSLKSDETGVVPAIENAMGRSCHGKRFGKDSFTTEEYTKLQTAEEYDIMATNLHTLESLSPFKLRRVYGRLENVPAINLTGIYRNHIAYATSNVVIILDYVENSQHCLQGHRNTITSITLEHKGRFLATTDAGKRSLIIVWDTLTGKPLKFYPGGHNEHGSIFACFTSVDFIFASIGAEEMGKQTISFWNFDSKSPSKAALFTEEFPKTTSLIRELNFLESRPEFFSATGDRNVLFGTWIRDKVKGDSLYFHKPKLRKAFIAKHKHFTCSLWMKKGEWLATATGAGYVCIWGPPVVLALEDPPDPTKNIREFQRSFKLCEEGITQFAILKDYVVVGDGMGIVRFFDHHFKLLRWSRNFNLPAIRSISFSRFDEIPEFKKNFREQYDENSNNKSYRTERSLVKDYTKGGSKIRQLSKTTIPRPPMPCPDFIVAVAGGDVFYYHFTEMQLDRLVPGTPGPFIACDVSPLSHHILLSTARGEVQLYEFKTHRLTFSDRIFSSSHQVTTVKFHPMGQFVSFGLANGHISFRRNYTWRTSMPPVRGADGEIVRIVYSTDGLNLACYDKGRTVSVFKYLPKGKGWLCLGRTKIHRSDVVDIQFFVDPDTNQNRLFTLGIDRHLIEYDIERSLEESGLFVIKVTRLEETCIPTAMVFNGPSEFGTDCITFANDINKLRVFSYQEDKVKSTFCGPVFGRDKGIKRMIEFPTVMAENRHKKFIVYVVRNKLGLMDTPLDGNPHKYMAVYTHPREIIEVAVAADRDVIFTIGKYDNSVFEWQASTRAVESTVLMGGSGLAPFYHTLRRHWGGACQDIIKDLDLIFFFLNVKRIRKQNEMFAMPRTIRLCEISAVCRACGFYPTEYEVELMLDEVRRLKQAQQKYLDDFKTEVSFEEFVKLFVNHFYRITDDEVEEAFKTLGFKEDCDEEPYICRHDFIKYMTEEGEPISSHNFPVYFEPMYGSQVPGAFGQFKCHTVEEESESSSSSSTTTEHSSAHEMEGETLLSSTSSSSEGNNEGEGADEASESHRERQSGEVHQDGHEDAHENEDDDYEEYEGEGGSGGSIDIDVEVVKGRKSVKYLDTLTVEGEESSKEGSNKSSDMIDNPEESASKLEVELEEDDLFDIPEKIDLSYFLDVMLPPECQQTIQWRAKPVVNKTGEELTARQVDKEKKALEEEFLNTILRQIVDPKFPIPKKMLNTLYAQFYLEHGNFAVPADMRYSGVALPGDSWYAELGDENEEGQDLLNIDGDAEETSEEEEEDDEEEEEEEGAEEDDEEEENIEEVEVEEGMEEKVAEKESKKKKKRKSKGEEDEEEEEGGEDDEGEEEEEGEDYEEDEGEDYEEEEGEGEDEKIPSELNEEMEDEEEEEDEEGSVVSQPFTMSTEAPRSPTAVFSEEGFSEAGTEDMTDLDNMYAEEDLEFVRNVNKSFRPQNGAQEKSKRDDL